MVFAALLIAAVMIVLGAVAGASRHQKSAAGELDLMGSEGSVETTLEPEGSVLIRGELWRARSRTGATVRRGERVRIVGASGCFLEVEDLVKHSS